MPSGSVSEKRGNGRAPSKALMLVMKKLGVFEEHQHANAAHNAIYGEEKPRALECQLFPCRARRWG